MRRSRNSPRAEERALAAIGMPRVLRGAGTSTSRCWEKPPIPTGWGRATLAPCPGEDSVVGLDGGGRSEQGWSEQGEREREKSRERHQHPTPGLCWGRPAEFSYVACLFVVSWFFFFFFRFTH